MTSTPDHEHPVRLSLPASPRYLAAARVLAASLGNDAGLSVDDLEDLRLGVNELVSALIAAAEPGARIVLELVADGATVTVTGEIEGGSGTSLLSDELSERILAAVVDSYELGANSFVLTKASSLRGHP